MGTKSNANIYIYALGSSGCASPSLDSFQTQVYSQLPILRGGALKRFRAHGGADALVVWSLARNVLTEWDQTEPLQNDRTERAISKKLGSFSGRRETYCPNVWATGDRMSGMPLDTKMCGEHCGCTVTSLT
jgi:hypothetical protein